jgi:predicted RNA-binding Zn ribbon-like protein
MASSGPERSNLALDFLHTVRRTRHGLVDLLATPGDLLVWLDGQGTSAPDHYLVGRVSVPEARTLLDEARRLRADIGALVEARATGGQLPALALYGLNRALAAGRWSWRLTPASSGGSVLEAHEEPATRFEGLGPIALAAARLVTGVEASRLRRCASPRCGAWFVDTSKGGRRRWCSMARCGNREKAATHRGKRRPR